MCKYRFLEYCLVGKHVVWLALVAVTWPLLKDALHLPPLTSLIKGCRVNTYICSTVVSSGFTAGYILNHLCGWKGCLNIRSILGPFSNRRALSIPYIFSTSDHCHQSKNCLISLLVTYLLICFHRSYTGHVVGNGLQAQRHNPEIKVRSADPILVNIKEKLERFNQVGPKTPIRTSILPHLTQNIGF